MKRMQPAAPARPLSLRALRAGMLVVALTADPATTTAAPPLAVGPVVSSFTPTSGTIGGPGHGLP